MVGAIIGRGGQTIRQITQQTRSVITHTVILPDWTLKNGASLILPSCTARNSSAPNAKRIFEILWGILEGRTNSAQPSRPCLKNCQNGTCMEFEIFGGQMTSFEVLLKCHSLTFSKKCLRLPPAPSKCLSERINWIISTIPHRIPKILLVYGSYNLKNVIQNAV